MSRGPLCLLFLAFSRAFFQPVQHTYYFCPATNVKAFLYYKNVNYKREPTAWARELITSRFTSERVKVNSGLNTTGKK